MGFVKQNYGVEVVKEQVRSCELVPGNFLHFYSYTTGNDKKALATFSEDDFVIMGLIVLPFDSRLLLKAVFRASFFASLAQSDILSSSSVFIVIADFCVGNRAWQPDDEV